MNRKDIIELLLTDPDRDRLFAEADAVRKKSVGDAVHVRGLVEFSNHCFRNCLYCGLRRDNTSLKRYRMNEGEIFECAKLALKMGYGTVVLQSGEDTLWPASRLIPLIEKIKSETSLAITLSVGEMKRADYFSLRSAGADRFLMRFETSDPNLFSRLKPDSSYVKRFDCLRWLKEAGFQVGSGIMVGLPGQRIESIAEDILLFRKLELDMIGIGPFIANPDTPLGREKKDNFELSLRTLAVARLVCPTAHMPATSAMEALNPRGREIALRCGANVIMPNLTPRRFKENYILYPGKICVSEEPEKCSGCIRSMLFSIGRQWGDGPGHCLGAEEK